MFSIFKKVGEAVETIGKAKILVVENSTNQEFKLSYEEKYPNLEVVLTGSNLGYGAGNNKGISLVKTKYVLISNPDVIYEDDFFNNLNNSPVIQLKLALGSFKPTLKESSKYFDVEGLFSRRFVSSADIFKTFE